MFILGLTLTEIGWVTASFDMTSLVSSFFVASCISPKNITFFYLVGVIWCAVSVATFGWSARATGADSFFHLSLASRLVNGVGASLLQNTALPIAGRLFPQNMGMMTAIIHTSLGLGLVIGPSMGSLLIPIGGYEFPFLMTGLAEGVAFIAAIFIIPSKFVGGPLKSTFRTTEFVKFLVKPKVWIFIFPSLMLFSTTGFRDSAFALYFQDYLGLSQEDTGYAFMACSGAFFIAAPLYGILVGHGYGVYILLVAQATAWISMLLFYLPKWIDPFENTYYALGILAAIGFLASAVFNPHYLIVEKIALSEGYKNVQEIKTLAAGSYNLLSSSSRAIGAFLFGGLINEKIGFYNTCLCYCGILFVTGTIQIVYFIHYKLVKRQFYGFEVVVKGPNEMSIETDGVKEGQVSKTNIKNQILTSISRSYNLHQM